MSDTHRAENDSARRYLAVIQDERGYPPPGELDKAPPDGPKPPMIHSVVLAEDYERVLRGEHRCGLCHGYGAANEATHEPVPCIACGKRSEGMVLVALDPPRDQLPPDSQHLGLRLIDGGAS